MSAKLRASTVGHGIAIAAILAAGAAQAEERKVIVTVDTSKTTHLTIKPLASKVASKAATATLPQDVVHATSCSASVTYNNGAVDADCTID